MKSMMFGADASKQGQRNPPVKGFVWLCVLIVCSFALWGLWGLVAVDIRRQADRPYDIAAHEASVLASAIDALEKNPVDEARQRIEFDYALRVHDLCDPKPWRTARKISSLDASTMSKLRAFHRRYPLVAVSTCPELDRGDAP